MRFLRGLFGRSLTFVGTILTLAIQSGDYISIGGKLIYFYTTAITANSTATTAVVGSYAITTNAIGRNQIFVSDGSYWQALLRTTNTMAGHTYLGAVAAATTTGAITQLSLNGVADGATATIAAQPKTPRNVKLTITDGNTSILTYSITVAGKAPDNTTISETFTFADGLTPAGSKVFASIASVTVNSITGDGASDTLDMGYGTKLGLPVPYGAQSLAIVKLVSNGTVEAASATDATNNSFTPTTAPDGTKVFEAWFSYGFPA